MSAPDVIDLFAGPGGWDEGVRPLGLRPLGFEKNPDACATAMAAGHARVQADIASLNPLDYAGATGLIASPPCQGWSLAGKGKGRQDAVALLARLALVHSAADVDQAIADLHRDMTDDRSLLVLEPLRWALHLRPAWLAWEQVPTVLPIWADCARILREHGYTTQTAVLSAEQYGVPQTRKRAVLIARDAATSAELGPVEMPRPTHSRFYPRSPERMDPGMPSWVSMKAALNWGLSDRPAPTITAGGTGSGGGPEPIAHLDRYTGRPGWRSRQEGPERT